MTAPTHRFGYARVSTFDQSTDLQIERLEAANCDKIYSEQVSATSRQGREQLDRVLEVMRKGDTLVVTKLDRLARNTLDLLEIVQTLESLGVYLEVLDQSVETKTPAGRAFLTMLGVFAEFETALRKERQLEGIEKAKAKGVYKGKAPLSEAKKKKVIELHNQGLKPAEIVKETGVGRTSVFKILKEIR